MYKTKIEWPQNFPDVSVKNQRASMLIRLANVDNNALRLNNFKITLYLNIAKKQKSNKTDAILVNICWDI